MTNLSVSKKPHRIHGLDVLRSTAIILVFMFHYMLFVSKQPTFGFFSNIGWVGVDLFFVLSGYLIGHQIFSALANQRKFSLKIFYCRRLLRTLPNYLVVLAIYFLIPDFREKAILPPLWRFLTFTQNFDFISGTAFSHAWSLCIEEQFYLILPLLALFIICKKTIRVGWIIVFSVLIAGMIFRSSLWIQYIQNAGENFGPLYSAKIYYSSFCRLDELVLGVTIAMLKNFHKDMWLKITAKGNLLLILSIVGTSITFYMFLHHHYGWFMTTFGYPLLAVSFAGLTLAALSPNSYLYRIRIPGAANLAIWSYAIYLVHKPLTVITFSILSKWGVAASSFITVVATSIVSIFGGWLLYKFVETPFLKLRDKITVMEKPSKSISESVSIIQ
jgi:peptidoglycan/LPS O-acetylase OafA/YrhL